VPAARPTRTKEADSAWPVKLPQTREAAGSRSTLYTTDVDVSHYRPPTFSGALRGGATCPSAPRPPAYATYFGWEWRVPHTVTSDRDAAAGAVITDSG
jgi:hypothetical protein